MIKRKNINNNRGIASSVVDINDDYLDDDPQRQEILKVWEESENDDENARDELEHKERLKQRSAKAFTAGSYYLIILVFIGIFIYICNIYNLKQLEKIKEEYGMDQKIHAPELWWKKALFYNAIVRSYKDSNSDGIGDFNGMRANVEHLIYSGVDAVILSRILESPFDDFGKDVSNFTKVDPVYGTLQDLKDLIQYLHESDIKVVLELNPNHSHRKHPYFELSRNNHSLYRDYYVWHNGKVLQNGSIGPPNNWVSRYGGSAWTWDTVRTQYYYHYYSAHTPDLNYWNTKVEHELQAVINYWLQQGFDGIYLEGCHVLYEIEDISLDEPLSEKDGVPHGDYKSVDHVFTEDHSLVHDFMTTVREWIDMASVVHNKKIALLVNIEDDQMGDIIKYYQTSSPVSHNLMQISHDTGGRELWDLIDSYSMHLEEGDEPVWMLSQLDSGMYKIEKELMYQNVLNMLMLLLPGAAISYMGEEIGVGTLTETQVKALYEDPIHQQTAMMMAPLPWSGSLHAEFSKVPSWLPLRDNYQHSNIQTQRSDRRNISPIHLYGKLSRVRKETSFINGNIQYSLVNDHIFSFMRFAKNSAPYLITINIGTVESTDDHTITAGVQYGKVVAYAMPIGSSKRSYMEGRTIDLQKVTLKPGEGLVLLLLLDIIMDASLV